MEFRHFDPEKDSLDELAELNDWNADAQEQFAHALRNRLLIPANAFVAVDDGRLVGLVMIMDGGFPFAIVDGCFIRPEYRTMENAQAFRRALEADLKRRGVLFFFS